MQGNGFIEPAGDVLDLDALLAARLLAPAPVRLGGHVYQVRTDLTGAEIADYLRLARAGKDVEAFRLLVGDDAERLDATLEALPKQHIRPAAAAILRASVVLAEYATTGPDDLFIDGEQKPADPEGGSSASSSGS